MKVCCEKLNIYFVKQKTVLVYLSAPLHKRAVFRRTSCLVFLKTQSDTKSLSICLSLQVYVYVYVDVHIYVLSQSQSLKNI